MGEGVKLVNPAYETAKSLKALLEEKGMRNQKEEASRYEYYVSDGKDKFVNFADRVLPLQVEHIEAINIENF